jgi:hypothetical protein
MGLIAFKGVVDDLHFLIAKTIFLFEKGRGGFCPVGL